MLNAGGAHTMTPYVAFLHFSATASMAENGTPAISCTGALARPLLALLGRSAARMPLRFGGGASAAAGAGTWKPRTRAEMAARTSGMRSLATGSVITSSMRGPLAAEVSSPSPMKTTVRLLARLSNIECGLVTMRSKKRRCSLCTSVPTMRRRSARLRTSVSVDMIQPLVCSTRKLRYCPSDSA